MAVRTGLERPEWQSRRHRPIRWEFRACGHRRERNGGAEGCRDNKASRARGSVRCDTGADPRGPRGADASARNTEDKGRAGGKKRGRRTKDDTSRFIYLVHVALPNLLFGKLPSVEDWTALFMPHSQATDANGKLLNSKADLKFLETWSKKVHPDPVAKRRSLPPGGRRQCCSRRRRRWTTM